MEIRNLYSFVRVAEMGSFTKAADYLGYTQSSISFQIKQLEEEFGCLLFERINHTILLTGEGKCLLEYAHKILQLSEESKQALRINDSLNGMIHVATPDSICEDMIKRDYLEFSRLYPEIKLKFTTADTKDMFMMLDQNKADVILTLDSHFYDRNYIVAREKRVNMHFVSGAQNPLSHEKNVPLTKIVEYPLFLTEKNMGYRRLFEEELAKRSIEVVPALEIGRTDLIVKLLEKSNGISYLPDFVTSEKVASGKLRYLDIQDFETEVWKQLIYHKNKWMSRILKTFIEYLISKEFD
ncbi:MAG: LysR family transcriptional regulator [Spirochaetales bacterium]|nr:LysR family transcriptional regulator [Spirochaetales bacterium]